MHGPILREPADACEVGASHTEMPPYISAIPTEAMPPSSNPPSVPSEPVYSPQGAGYGEASDEQTIDLREIFDILLRGKWIILGCLLAVTLPAALWTLQKPSLYNAYSIVLVDKKDEGMAGILPSQGQLSFLSSERNLENELLVIRQSLPLAEAAAESLYAYSRAPGATRPLTILQPTDEVPQPTVRDIVFRIPSYISAVQEGKDVDAIRIVGVSVDPAEAALLANVYADAFVALTRDQSRLGVMASREFLQDQVVEKGGELAQLDQDVRRFMDREGAVALDQETSQLVTQLATLEGERDAAEIQIQQTEATLRSIQSEIDRIQPTLSARLSSDIDGQLGAAQVELREAQAALDVFYTRNPEMRDAETVPRTVADARSRVERANARVQTLGQRLAAESAAGGGGPGDTQAAFQRVSQLRQQHADTRIVLDGLIGQRRQLNTRIASYEAELAQIPSQSIDLAQLQRERISTERLYQTLDQRLQETRVAEESELGYAHVIRPAFASPVPFAPNRLRDILLAALAGLMLGVVVAMAKVRLDHRFFRPDDLTERGYTLLGTVPDFEDLIKKDFEGKETVTVVGGREIDTRVISLLNPMSTASESYRALRTSVQFSRPDAVVQTILVTSASPSEGKSVTASNLAVVMAQAGRRVLLVDCDLRRPTTHKKFGLPREPGLTQLVFGEGHLDVGALAQPADDFWVLPAGSLPPNPSELLGSRRMRDVIADLKSQFDVVILDAPPVHAATDAVLLSTQADATIVVVRAAQTKDYDLDQALAALHNVGSKTIGVVLNGFNLAHAYGYKYRYDYRYGEDYKYYAYGHENQTTKATT